MAGLYHLLTRSSRTGAGTILDGGREELSESGQNLVDYPRIPTGIFPMDFASGGGIPCNAATQFYGPYQGGKSTLAYLTAKSLSKTCMRCLKPLALCACPEANLVLVCPTCKKPFGECAHKADPMEQCGACGKTRLECACGCRLIQKTFLCQLEGLPPGDLYLQTLGYRREGNMIIGTPEYGEMACEQIEAAIRADDCGLVIVDSLAARLPKAEMDGAYEDVQVGAQSRLIGKLSRRLAPLLVQEFRRGHLVGVIVINQLRANIGGGKWDPSEKVPGGWAVKHWCRLSVRVNQLAVDADKGEKDKDGMKNVGRFSVSLLGPESKQQMLILAPKAEYKIVVRDWNGYEAGRCLDAATAATMARDAGLLEKGPKYYDLKGTGMRFRVLSDIEEMFRTGDYADPDSGEVTPEGDVIFRHAVLEKAKQRAVEEIQSRAAIRVNTYRSHLA